MLERLTVAVYRAFLRLMPGRWRSEYGRDAAELFAWQLGRTRGLGRMRFLAGSLADIMRQATLERRAVRRPPGSGEDPESGRDRRRRLNGGFEALVHDLRTSIRSFLRQPSFTVPVVLTLGLGIGLATAMVAVVQGVLLRPLPYPDGDSIAVLRERTEPGGRLPASILNFADWREGARSFEAMSAVVGPQNATLRGLAEPVRAPVLFVSADFFRVAGVTPAVGRWLSDEEQTPGGPPAVVVSHELWTRSLDSRRDVTSVRLRLADLLGREETYTVVGVAPAGFDLMGDADVWAPLDRAIPWNIRGNHVVAVVGRLGSGVAMQAAAAEVDAIQARIRQEHGDETDAIGVAVSSLRDDLTGPVRTPVLLLLVGALLLLVSAFLDAAGALLARGVARRRELRVRVSLGATRGRLLIHLLLECGLLAAGGLAIGLLVARSLLSVLVRLSPPSIPRLEGLEPQWLGLALAGAALAGVGMLLFGGGASLLTTRHGTAALRGRTGTTRGVRAAWNGLIAAEVALALMLLTTAGVLGRSLWRIVTADTGFDPDSVVTAQVNLPAPESAEAFIAYFETALSELRTLPGVQSAGVANLLPIEGAGSIGGPVELEDGERSDVVLQYRVADAGYFQAMDIRLRQGRLFDATDRPGAPHAAVINTSMATRLWPDRDPIGRRFNAGGMDPYRDQWLTVVGVVEEARPWSVEPGSYPMYWVDYRQRPDFLFYTGADFVVRTADPDAGETIRATLTSIEPDAPVLVRSLDARLASRTADRRFILSLLGVFAGLALALTAVGIWGVISFIVSRRMRDSSIRLALGAMPSQVQRGLQREAAPAVIAGLALGSLFALGLIRFVRSQLYGVGVFDPVALATVALALGCIAWLASYIPARRVRRIEAGEALRTD